MPKPEHPFIGLKEICLRKGVSLVVVSKTRTPEEILVLYRMGQKIFAENRAQDLMVKVSLLPEDIEWHLIGHLQTNKVKSILPLVSCIQSLDSEKLWKKIHEEALKQNKKVNCLLQIKVATEATKYGWSYEILDEILKSGKHKAYSYVSILGVMGMASLTADKGQVRNEMKQLKFYFDSIRENYFKDEAAFNTISMGMSGDYPIALEEGSTMIRIGSLLFPQ